MENVILCESNDVDTYTDLTESNQFIDFNSFVPKLNDYKRSKEYSEDDVEHIIKVIKSLKSAYDEEIPVRYLVPLIVGNIGEYIMTNFLEYNKVAPLRNKDIIDMKMNSIYELYDYYFINKNNELICMDVKYWGHKDKTENSMKLIKKLESKSMKVQNIVKELSLKGQKYIYVNTNPSNNKHAINELDIEYRNSVMYINLIVLKTENAVFFTNKKTKNRYDETQDVKSKEFKLVEYHIADKKILDKVK